MATRYADSPFNLDDYMRRLGLDQPADQPASGGGAPANTNLDYDPYRTSPATSPTGGTSDVVDWSGRQSAGRGRIPGSENPGPWDTTPYDPNPGPADSTPSACPPGSVPESIGANGEWRTAGPGECITQEEFNRRVDLNIKNNPYPGAQAGAQAGNAGGGSGGSSGGAKAAPNYAFDLQALLKMLGPQYDALIASIRAGTNPYDPSTVEALVGNRKVAAERQKLDQRNLLQAQRSAAGMGTQGETQQDIRERAASADIASASDINTIRENAIKANYAAKIGRIDQEINTLNSYANLVLGLASSDSSRQSTQLQYAAQLNSLLAQRQNLELQLQAELDRLYISQLYR